MPGAADLRVMVLMWDHGCSRVEVFTVNRNSSAGRQKASIAQSFRKLSKTERYLLVFLRNMDNKIG